ncbi:hypothetical protein D8890_07760 [Streptococcus sanguinis]|uniref:DUF4097 family beta strand repeat-containing protein n=1 Tax=Streptococcus TaxID=1301 RepID=UPI0006609416|nr:MULTISPECIES: DUF4097 family beta strand repeat-containing protein [Streptococcus]MBF1689666.1 DUF4097 family beta strand repeat protein [Streptococcus cristatus]MBZ2058268.1 DUF4097 domain-containing protein [Streptococcus sanguinis]MDN5013156.1 DUF4097 family beta strand repeat-containing protein [Streptococcus sp. SN3]RSI04388.1 hypothetical protein D8890_07760 [Streptococcus sanguinis]
MANIKLKKPLLSAAILACLFGGALTTIGSITGGVNDLVNSTKSKVKLTKKEESFSDLSSLNINLAARNLVISESPDDKAHLTYYQRDGNYQIGGSMLGKITTSSENGNLNIKEDGADSFHISTDIRSFHISTGIRSLLSLFDQESQEKRTVELSLPKGTKLETFSGSSSLGDVTLSNLSAKNADFSLSQGSLTVNDGQFASGKFKNSLGEITINNSQISSGKIIDSSGTITLSNSQFASGEISNSLGEVNLNSSKISDSTLKISSGSLNSEQLELAGTISITNQLGDINLHLVSGSLSQLSFDLKTDLGEIDIPSSISVEHSKGHELGGSAIRKVENPTTTLTASAQSGSIKLSE